MSQPYISQMYLSEINDTNQKFPLKKPIETPSFDLKLDEFGNETRASFEKNKGKVMCHYNMTFQKFMNYPDK